MSPPSQSIDHNRLIIDNSHFISIQGAEVRAITTREPSGDWKAIVLRSNNGVREALLSSEPCDSPEKALESLHVKTAEAAAVYIKNNGFGHLVDPSKGEDDDLSDDDETASVVSSQSRDSLDDALSVSDSSDEELVTPASSSPPKEVRSSSAGFKVSPKKRGKRGKARRSSRSYESESSEEIDLRHGGPPPPPPGMFQHPPMGPLRRAGGHGPPPPPPGFLHPKAHPGIRPMGPPANQPPRPPVSMPPPGVVNAPPYPLGLQQQHPNTRPRDSDTGSPRPLHDVAITVHWAGHGEQRFIDATHASVRALQDAALLYVRGHTGTFDNVTPLDQSPGRAWALRATLRQAWFGNEAYSMSGYRGDDLARLFGCVVGGGDKDVMPKFDIDVDYAPSPMPPPMPMPYVA
ncbi:hypothetical protein LQW54_010679 [Pestalotiopsis sp. IQ-011]